MAAAATAPAANGTSGMSSGTLHYSRDASSTSQAPPVLPSPHPVVNGFGRTQQRRAYDDEDDDQDGESLNEWRRRQSYTTGNINIQSYANGDFPGDTAMAGEAELAGLADGMQHWANKRHLTSGNPRDVHAEEQAALAWRLRSRLKTFSAALTLCLNIGVDPPDVVKTQPCAKLECWVDPGGLPGNKALENVGRNLQQQFETLSPKVRYKQYLDPSVEETKKFCLSLRKSAKEERVLMYYNGHGVPKPTTSGEIWVFNKNYTQYIPVSLYDLQSWLGSPCIFVWDCSAAGNIIQNFNRWARRRDDDAANDKAGGTSATNPDDPNGQPQPVLSAFTPFMDCIHLAACQADQVLPMTPELPADLFTCCLTSPIEIALRFFVLQDPLRVNVDEKDARGKVTVDSVMKIPGDLKDRRTPLGELNWIFTAVTDTIAWLVFPRDIFKRLFRQDLLVAALFRNFLLAERIMRAYHCTPMSHPELPATHNHPLWQSWDLAVDACLAQLPALLEAETFAKENPGAPPQYVYQPSKFFGEHLQAFEVWLQQGGSVSSHLSLQPKLLGEARKPPDQLPIVLQVLLSQAHRLRALILLSKFVDLGPWAVHLALSIGIFPYVQKLLQSPAVDLKPVLIFIWARILAVDRSCQVDLLKDNGFSYFSRVLAPQVPTAQPLLIPNIDEHRAMCAFILSMVCRGFRQGQMACMSQDIFRSCFDALRSNEDWLLKQWSALCIAQVWADGNDDAKMLAIREGYQDELLLALKDESAEVRAASMYALGTFLGATGMPADANNEPKGGGGTGGQVSLSERRQLKLECGVAQACVLQTKVDASPLVRKELVVVLSCAVREWRGWFVAAAWAYHEQENRSLDPEMSDHTDVDGDTVVAKAFAAWGARSERTEVEHNENITILLTFKLMFAALLDLSVDPHPEVATLACTVVDYVTALLLDSAFTRARGSTLRAQYYMEKTRPTKSKMANAGLHSPSLAQLSMPQAPDGGLHPAQPTLVRSDTASSTASRVTSTLKRTNSVVNVFKNLASMTGYATPPPPEDQASNAGSDTTEPTERKPAASKGNPLHIANYVPPYPLARANDMQHAVEKQKPVERTSSHGNVLSSYSQLHITSKGPSSTSSGRPRVDANFDAAHVIEALTEEDMERLRIRRTSKSQAGGGADGKSANSGMAQPHELGLGMVAKEVKDDVLPLRSDLYDYSLEYYKEPQMKIPDADEPGSVKYNEQTWRHQRNQKMMERTRGEDELAANSPWTTNLGSLPNDAWPSVLSFHSFEPELAVADEGDNICIWDWKVRRRISRFSNSNGRAAATTSMHFINETASSLLLTAASDGNIRIWRDYLSPAPSLVSAFRGIDELTPTTRSAGIVTAWSQRPGQLLVGGDMRSIRLWDARTELLAGSFPTQAGSNVTSLSADESSGGDIFVAGFGDGVIRVFDKRVGLAESEETGLIKVMRQHNTWLQSVWLRSDGELITGSMNGEIKVFDLRMSESALSSTFVSPNGLSSLAVHQHSRVFAATSGPTRSYGFGYGNSHAEVNSINGGRQGGMSSSGQGYSTGRTQRLGVWRLADMANLGVDAIDSGEFDFGYAALDVRQGINGSMSEKPTRLSDIALRGDTATIGGSVSGASSAAVVAAQVGSRRSQRLYGAGMNAMVFHPNELLVAVGGFDHTCGGVRLVSYDKKTGE